MSDDVTHELIVALRRKEILNDLAIASFEATEDASKLEKVKELTKLLEEEASNEDTLNEVKFVTSSLEELYVQQVKATGLRWRLGSLNRALGSLRKGDFGFVFARPETGKTTFLASECTLFASQTSGPVLWFNNEEQGEKVMLRCYQAALGITLEQLLSNRKKHEKAFRDLVGDRLKIYDAANIYKSEVEDICAKFSPSLVIFDQIDKIAGFKADRNDLQLGEIYIWARELAKTFCPAIGVCQADGTGEGQKWLTMAHVANAKTSKQAEADWILGIGRSNDAGYESVRHFNISKNKLLGDEDTVPEMRHGRWDVKILPQIARYEDYLLK